MTRGLLFWVVFLLYVILGLWGHREDFRGGNYTPAGSHLVLLILIFLLGWGLYGFIVR